MRSLRQRIAKRINMTTTAFRSDCHFSVYYAMLRVAAELGGRMGFRRVSAWARQKKEQWIFGYLRDLLAPVLAEYQNTADDGAYAPDTPIWVCWWTGEETAPALVSKCIQSIKKHSAGHPVHVIDQHSYGKYLYIPDYLLHKVNSGQMGLAHLSDYIRVSVLAEYGGLWLDATIFCSDTIPQTYFELPLFTCRSEPQPCGYISQMRWTTFVLGGWKGHTFYRYLKTAFETYWQHSDTAIDYLFFDYLIELARQEIPSIRQALEAVPLNNPHRDDLQAAMNAALPAGELENVLHPDTTLYKLSWRESYALKDAQGGKSIYTAFIEDTLG